MSRKVESCVDRTCGQPRPSPWESPWPVARADRRTPTPARSRPRPPPRREDQARRGHRHSPKLLPTPSACAATASRTSPIRCRPPAEAMGIGRPELTRIRPRSKGPFRHARALPSPWNSTGQQLTAAQQQAWLNWAGCIRSHGVSNFPDPTFSGREVHDSGVGVELAAAAVGDERLQEAVCRWTGRVTGNGRLETGQLIASAHGAECSAVYSDEPRVRVQ